MRASGNLPDTSDEKENAEEIPNVGKGALGLGASENTRFGVIAKRTGDPAPTAQSLVDTPVGLTIRTPAHSPKPMSRMTALPSRSEARYAGQTVAVATAGDVSSGTINLCAWLGIERIDADITNMTIAKDDGACQHDGRAVTEIRLPRATEAGLRTDADGDADLTDSGFPTKSQCREACPGALWNRARSRGISLAIPKTSP